MTVLLVHNRYQQPGGEDQVYDAECALLRAHGVEVIPYEVHNDAVDGMGRLSLCLRTLWNWSTYRAIRDLIRTHRPSVVHCHNIFPLISPSIYWACRKEGVPVVQTLHNFRLTCLNAYLFRDGVVCERCFGRFPWPGLKRRCYRDSLAASGVAALSWLLHVRLLRTYDRAVTRFIALTEFGRDKMLRLGFSPDKVSVKPNFIAFERTLPSTDVPRPRAFAKVLFVGRLSSEKGADVLVAAWRLAVDRLPESAQLVIIGDGPERGALAAAAAETRGISFEGRRSKAEVLAAMQSASVVVLPSLCYETFGMVVAEAFSCGCPAIVPNHGALASLVEDGVTGFLFRPGDSGELAETLVRALSDPAALAELGRRAAAFIGEGDFTPERNVRRLMDIYREAGQTRGCGRGSKSL